MATISSKAIIDKIIANDGIYDEDDPPVALIVQYTSMSKETCWGVTWVNESPESQTRYLTPTQYINNPMLVWWNKMFWNVERPHDGQTH